MVDRIDMSLDEIIKSNKKSAFHSKSKVGGGKGVSGKVRSRSRSRGGPPKSPGGVMKAKSRSRSSNRISGARGVKSGKGGRRGQSAGSMKRSRSRSRVRRQSFQIKGVSGGLSAGGPGKLIISNLDIGVSDTDIQELFAEFGVLKSADLHYDRNGKSLGTADVVFERRVDSVKAMKQYDGVPLDGRPMKIEMAAPQGVVAGVGPGRPRPRSASMPRNRRSRSQGRSRSLGLGGVRGGRVTKRGVVRGYKQKGGIGKKQPIGGNKKDRKFRVKGGVKKGGKKKPLPVSRETLDKEIDSFMKSRETES